MDASEGGGALKAPSLDVIRCSKSMIDLSDEEQAAVVQLLESLSDDLVDKHREVLTRDTLLRFLRARRGNLKKAHKMLTGHLEWREKYIWPKLASNGGKVGCPLCPNDPNAHSFTALGLDNKHRPVVYGGPARAANTGVEETTQHVVHFLEEMFRVHDAEPENQWHSDRTTWCWIVDFKGFGFSHAMNVRQALSFSDILSNHYPERLGVLVLLDPPSVFSILLKAVQPVVDKRTLDKIVLVQKKDYDSFLSELLPNDVKQWVLQAVETDAKPGALPQVPSNSFLENLVPF
jgi:hypothetical protein